jgi:hypothetical protein
VQLWEVWKTGRVMACEINEHSLGWEIRCYLRGDFHYSRVSRTRVEAEQEAEAKRQGTDRARLDRSAADAGLSRC